MSAAVVPIRRESGAEAESHGMDVSEIDPLMFAQHLADRAQLEHGTLRFTLMIASALIARSAEASNS